jgi:hypothetical protein
VSIEEEEGSMRWDELLVAASLEEKEKTTI